MSAVAKFLEKSTLVDRDYKIVAAIILAAIISMFIGVIFEHYHYPVTESKGIYLCISPSNPASRRMIRISGAWTNAHDLIMRGWAALEISKRIDQQHRRHSLYLIDEPTTGMHPVDVENFLSLLNRMVDSGNTEIVVEHNQQVIRDAGWIIDLGPEGGVKG